MKERIIYPKIRCNHEITKFPFCNKCCCIYDSNKKIASINKRLNSLIKEINFGSTYKNIVIQEENELNKINKIKSKYIYIKNRKEIIEKFFKVITIYKYSLSTFYLAIFLMDEIFYKVNLNKKYFLSNEEIALGSLFLAIKSLELEKNVSSNLSKIQSFFSPSIIYSIERLKIIEILCLKKLNYNIYRITPYDYLNLFIKIGVIFSNEILENTNLNVVYLNSNISKLSYEILDSLMKNTNEYFKIKPNLIALGIILYAKEKIMHINNIEMFIYAYNISKEEIIKTKNFIKENSERKNKLNDINNIINKDRKNNKSQSPLKNQYYQLKKSFLIRPFSLSSVSSRPSSMKKSSLGSNVSTSSDDINNVNMNQKIKITMKNYSKENSIDFSYSYTAQNTINSKRNKNLIKIRPLSQISEMRKSNILVNNKKLNNLNEVKSNLSQKINKHKLSIKEMLKENEKKKNNYASLELSYLISQTSNKSIYNNNKKKNININIKPFKLNNNNLEKKQKEKEKGHYKKTKINNVLKSTINLNKKINKRTHSLTTSVSREKKSNLNLIPLPKKTLINYCKFVNQKAKIL